MKTMRPLRVFGGGLSCVATYSLDRSSFNTEPGLRFSRFGHQIRCKAEKAPTSVNRPRLCRQHKKKPRV